MIINENDVLRRLILELSNKLESQVIRDANLPYSYKELLNYSYDYLNDKISIEKLNNYFN